MPWSQTPVVTCTLAKTRPGLLSSAACKASTFIPNCRDLSHGTTIIHLSGLNTEPAISLRPASDPRYRFCPWTSLMSCWLNFAHVGLQQTQQLSAGASSALPNARASPAERCIAFAMCCHPLGNNIKFHPPLGGIPAIRI